MAQPAAGSSGIFWVAGCSWVVIASSPVPVDMRPSYPDPAPASLRTVTRVETQPDAAEVGALVHDLRAGLAAAADPAAAPAMQAYMKSALPYYGVTGLVLPGRSSRA